MGSPRKRYDITYKVLIVGENGVGKTALLDRYTHPERPFNANLLPTIGIDYRTCYQTVDSLRIRVQIWDTVGQERFRTMTKLYFRGAKGVLLVFDVTDRDSFLKIANWVDGLKEYGLERECLMLIGNKVDLESKREVEESEGQRLARGLGMAYHETSAKSGSKVDKVFSEIIKNMKDANNPNDVGGLDKPMDGDLDEDWEQIFSGYLNEQKDSSNRDYTESSRLRGCCSS